MIICCYYHHYIVIYFIYLYNYICIIGVHTGLCDAVLVANHIWYLGCSPLQKSKKSRVRQAFALIEYWCKEALSRFEASGHSNSWAVLNLMVDGYAGSTKKNEKNWFNGGLCNHGSIGIQSFSTGALGTASSRKVLKSRWFDLDKELKHQNLPRCFNTSSWTLEPVVWLNVVMWVKRHKPPHVWWLDCDFGDGLLLL